MDSFAYNAKSIAYKLSAIKCYTKYRHVAVSSKGIGDKWNITVSAYYHSTVSNIFVPYFYMDSDLYHKKMTSLLLITS